MKALILSLFDNIQGPIMFHVVPEAENPGQYDFIAALMNLYDEGFFLHTVKGTQSANYIFKAPSDLARGRAEILQVSIITYLNRSKL